MLTIQTNYLLLILPTITMFYMIWKIRNWLWINKKPLSICSLFIGSLISLGAFLKDPVNKLLNERKNKERQQTAQKIAEIKEQREKLTSVYQDRRELFCFQHDKQPNLQPCENPIELHLPKPWNQLYQTLQNCSYFEPKFQAVESFTAIFNPHDVPPLPAAGFNLIVKQLEARSDDQTWNHIYRLRDALLPYIAPYNPEPTCKLVKEDHKKNKT